ncbi:hypothetical protein MHM88_05835 [Epibacterium sp. MM17-32]|uniref:hypothetical protein n=1 Tax=Epibacterium sp. MM17-32 TaxID=2917734 RepID=UPI001EF651B3|nr:hypothetical protein [Epibacterium sp. MM17-32]MCG7627319.1 hypothetical protein [Epibacterium sp. MM17-32]
MSDPYKAQSAMIGKILELLEPHGIEPISVNGNDLTSDKEELGLFINSMNWLIKEEIIRVDRYQGITRWVGCHLSAKGMYLLGRQINIGGDLVPMRSALKEAQSGTWDHAKFGDFIGGVFGGVFKSINS